MHQFCSEMAKQNTRKNKRKEKLVSILSGKLLKKKKEKRLQFKEYIAQIAIKTKFASKLLGPCS